MNTTTTNSKHVDSSSPRPTLARKRQRHDDTTTTGFADDALLSVGTSIVATEDLSQFLEGDDFVTVEDKQEAEAAKRRLERKRRLEILQQQQEEATGIKDEIRREAELETDNSQQRGSIGTFETTGVHNIVKSEQSHSVSDLRDGDDHSSHNDQSVDEFDMFSSSVSPAADTKGASAASSTNKRGHDQDDWDDAEGYYKAVIGEIITLCNNSINLRVSGIVGKGVFSTVIKCTTVSNSSSYELPPIVAIKCIRHNETMAKAALNELHTLQKLKGAPGVVPLLMPSGATPLDHRGHVIMVFGYMDYNLRDVLQKFGKGVGLSLQAVRSYFGQLLAAATHLQKHGIIHADLKPDNILVSSDFGVVQLADFGSAIHVNSPEQSQVTPYLVSRYYRSPEIILGLTPTFAVDLWSLAVSVAEVFLGDVVFRGTSNNEMLYVFMQHLGAFSNRMIRQHLVQCQKSPIRRHFQQEGPNYVFTMQTVDPVTGAPVHKVFSLNPQNNEQKRFPLATPLKQKLLKAKSAKDSKKTVLQFADLLQQCLALDPSKRIALREALRHEFFKSAMSTATSGSSDK